MQDYKIRPKKNCAYFFMKLDYEILKPLLIYKFDRERMHREGEFANVMMNDQDIIASAYGQLD